MTKMFLVFGLIFISFASKAQMVVGNGGGLIESQLVFVWSGLSSYVKPCLESQTCGLTKDEKKVVSAIAAEVKNKPLIFLKESERASLAGKFFETEAEIGAQVYINLDSLYVDGEKILLEKRDFHESVLQLVAAKSIQYGLDLEKSYIIGRKVADLARTQVAHVGLAALGFPLEGFSVFSSIDSSLLFISDSQDMFELNEIILKQVPCNGARIKQVTNLFWSHFTEIEATAEAQLFGTCGGLSWSADLELKLNYFLSESESKRQLNFDVKKTSVSIFDFE